MMWIAIIAYVVVLISVEMDSKKKRPEGKAQRLKRLQRECSGLWREIVKLTAENGCEWCDKMGQQAHHMINKSRCVFLRHEPRNGVWLCIGCHLAYHRSGSITGDRLFQQQRPDDYDYIDKHQRVLLKYHLTRYGMTELEWYEQKHRELTAHLKDLHDELGY